MNRRWQLSAGLAAMLATVAAHAQTSSAEEFTSNVKIQGAITQSASGNNVKQDVNLGSAQQSRVKSFKSDVTTGNITQTGRNGAQQTINVGGMNNSRADRFDARVTTGNIEQVANRGERQELDIGSVSNSIVAGTARTRVSVGNVKQTGEGEIALGAVKNSNVQQFQSNLSVKGKIEGNNIRMGSVIGQDRYDNRGRLMGQQSGDMASPFDTQSASRITNPSIVNTNRNEGTGYSTKPVGAPTDAALPRPSLPSIKPKSIPGDRFVKGNWIELRRPVDNVYQKSPVVQSDPNDKSVKDALELIRDTHATELYATLFTSAWIYRPQDNPDICISDVISSCSGQRWVLLSYKADSSFLNGFVAGTFFDTQTGKFYVTFGGTKARESGAAFLPDFASDVFNDVLLFTGGAPQQTSAINYLREVLNKYEGVPLDAGVPQPQAVLSRDNLLLTGHSLGGGLAAYIAENFGLNAWTVNRAPTNVLTAPVAVGTRLLLGYETLGNVINYFSQSDFMTRSLPPYYGTNHLLPFDTGHDSMDLLNAYEFDTAQRYLASASK